MKKYAVIIVALLVLLPVLNLTAQDKAPAGGAAKEGGGDTTKAAKVKEPLQMGNMIYLNSEIAYKLLSIPFYSLGVGMDFQMGERMALGGGIGLIMAQVSADETFSGAIDVTGGSINYLYLDLNMKVFITNFFWIGFGFEYEMFMNGYYIDNNVSDIHTPLDNVDIPNKLAAKFGLGLFFPVGSSTRLMPYLSVRYFVPASESYTFATSDITLNIGLNVSFILPAILKEFSE